MSRYYHVDIAAHVADADRKWVDNLLSHFNVSGVEADKQGVSRLISATGVHHIALIRHLTKNLSLSVERSIDIAAQLLRSHGWRIDVSDLLTLGLDEDALRRQVEGRLADAVEAIVPARRGRPPGSRTKQRK